MAASDPQLPIILYHYPYSPYAKRIVWYLELRGIPYSQCLQPPILPRPDLARLGISYRRIPVLSIGRDIYLDTRLILAKLSLLHPPTPSQTHLSPASTAEHKAIERLLEIHAIDGGLFTRASQLLPPTLPLLRDPKFRADRADYTGTKPDAAAAAALRPEALNEVQRAMALLETTLLADGRDWVLATPEPSLADIEAVWPLHWLVSLPGALPAGLVAARFPRVAAWIARFDAAVAEARARVGKPRSVSGEEAQRVILAAGWNEEALERGGGMVDGEAEPVVAFHGLRKGAMVELWPTDSGSAHRDVGALVAVDAGEVVITTAEGVRLHAPRHGFRFEPAGKSVASL
ncbi:hypothetical protein B0T22DRAFT_202464 [Podospora appendiculata]|uniref:GST N-terminal domain-containing protein n=1 Tax=Podospora appendiculata TaxID=314037 RepID=A0AAE1C9V1_9PEZI|nr:hypothetical protein B0T22DRAFT_202464 [Podospora appendiculata]